MKTPNSKIYYHIVFCTKYRRKVINPEIEIRVKELLKQSLEENPNNKKAQFYSLFCEEKIKECFEFLNKNELNIQIVQKFLNSIWHKKELLDDSQKLKERYNLTSEQSDLYYYVQKKDYKWLYKYFNNNEQRNP